MLKFNLKQKWKKLLPIVERGAGQRCLIDDNMLVAVVEEVKISLTQFELAISTKLKVKSENIFVHSHLYN